jgi:hypothetical protein
MVWIYIVQFTQTRRNPRKTKLYHCGLWSSWLHGLIAQADQEANRNRVCTTDWELHRCPVHDNIALNSLIAIWKLEPVSHKWGAFIFHAAVKHNTAVTIEYWSIYSVFTHQCSTTSNILEDWNRLCSEINDMWAPPELSSHSSLVNPFFFCNREQKNISVEKSCDGD